MRELLTRIDAAQKATFGVFDFMRERTVVPDELFVAEFKVSLHEVVVSLVISEDGTFKVGGSTAFPTLEFIPYSEAIQRAAAFVKAAALIPAVRRG